MKLCDYKENVLYEGTVFRFRGKEPFEKSVDFMLVCYPDTESGFALYCISGYHKGKLEVCLPKEALGKTCRAVLVEWVLENWNRWIYQECPVEDVNFII